MMKLLFQKLYEPQSDWFGKKGVSLHGAMFLYRETLNGPLMTEYHDNFTEDDRQNCFFFCQLHRGKLKKFQGAPPRNNQHENMVRQWTPLQEHFPHFLAVKSEIVN